MASTFGDDGVDDLFNDNIGAQQDQLPSDSEQAQEGYAGENLFDDENQNEDADAAEGEQGVKIEPKKRAVRNPRPRLTVDTLRGPRGIHTIEDYYKDMKFKGKGCEKSDLDEVLRRLQHWGHRMYPNYTFDDVLNNIERLGKKKTLQVHMSRYRLGQLENMRVHDAELNDDIDDENVVADEPFDEFDALLGEQIAISKLVPRTPATNPRSKSRYAPNATFASSSSTLATPSFSRNAIMSTPFSTLSGPTTKGGMVVDDISDYAKPLPPSQPQTPTAKQLSSDQMARIAENRRLAQERLRAKQMQQTSNQPVAGT